MIISCSVLFLIKQVERQWTALHQLCFCQFPAKEIQLVWYFGCVFFKKILLSGFEKGAHTYIRIYTPFPK